MLCNSWFRPAVAPSWRLCFWCIFIFLPCRFPFTIWWNDQSSVFCPVLYLDSNLVEKLPFWCRNWQQEFHLLKWLWSSCCRQSSYCSVRVSAASQPLGSSMGCHFWTKCGDKVGLGTELWGTPDKNITVPPWWKIALYFRSFGRNRTCTNKTVERIRWKCLESLTE